jgi:trimeric autotransporter adhesin
VALIQRTPTAVAAGTGRTASGTLTVLAPTTTALTLSPEVPAIAEPVTLTATVEGADTAGLVTFADGETVLGTADVVEGVATLEVADGFLAGEHAIVATFEETATAGSSTSEVVTFLLVKGQSTIALTIDAAESAYGTPVTGTVQVGGSTSGTVTLGYGSTTTQLELVDGTATFALPAGLAPGTYTVSAVFDGTAKVEASGTVTAEVVVAKGVTESTVTVPATVTVGGTVSGTVTVAGATAGTVPSGSVTVQVKKGSGSWTNAATATLGSTGRASYSFTAPTSVGGLSVRAVYPGDATYAGSTSAPAALRVVKRTTTTEVSAPAKAKVGASIPVTVVVRPTAVTVGGTVRVYTQQGTGAWTLVRTATVGTGGKVSLSVKGKAVGTLTVKAVFASTGALTSSVGTDTVTIVK